MKALVLLGLVFICLSGVAQKPSSKSYEIKGTVIDTQSPIEFAQVLSKSKQDAILGYSFTDSLGHYSLSFKTDQDSIVIQVSRLGYATKIMELSPAVGSVDFTLELSSDSKLSEIVIAESQSVETEGDTIRYSVETFRDGSERNVEDLLEQLPGISVDRTSGIIKYQGKEIKKILLDGDDLTGNNYKVLSKNLSADWLDEVEVLKRFTDSRLLQGIQQSNEVALNLKLKEDAKAPLFGTITAGLGTTSKYSGKAEFLSYLKGLKLFAVGVANNTGVDLETYDLETYANRQVEYKGFLLAEQVVNNQLEPPYIFDPEKFTFHEGQFASNSMVIRPSSKLSIRSTTTLYNNRLNFNFRDSLSYILSNQESLEVTQQQDQIQKPLEVFQDTKLDYQLSKNKDFSSRLRFKHRKNQLKTFNQTFFLENMELDNQGLDQLFGSLSYTNRLSNKWAYTTDVEFGFDQLDEKLSLNSDFENPTDSIDQSVNQKYLNFGVFSHFYGVLPKKFYANILLGWSKTSSNFDANVFARNTTLFPSSISNNYAFDNLFGQIQLKKHLKTLTLTAGGRIRNAKIALDARKTSQVLVEPSVSISSKNTLYKLLNTEIKALFNREYSFIKPNMLFASPLLSNFRSIVTYSSTPNTPTKRDFMLASLKIVEDRKSYMTGNIEWGYVVSDQVLVNSLSFTNDVVETTQLQGGRSRNFFSIYSLDKYFSILRTNIKLKYESTYTLIPLIVENVSDENRQEQKTLEITSGTSLSNRINLSLAFKKQKFINRWAGNTSNFDFNNYIGKVNIKLSSQLNCIIDFRHVSFGEGYGGPSSIVNSRFRFVNKKIELELTLNNIANNKSVEVSAINPSVYSSSNYPLLPRFFLLSGKYRF